VLAGVVWCVEKTVYRCNDFPNDGEQVTEELRFEVIEKPFEGIERCDSLIHGVRSW
jgi:hypothetical protein